MNKTISISLITAALILPACSNEKKAENIKGDDYIGVWINHQGQLSKSQQDVVVNDRVIIEKKADKSNAYSATILAKGIFAELTFKPENGLLCASNGACFQLKNGKLNLGSQQGVLTYERETGTK